jgi:hypothetical protein
MADLRRVLRPGLCVRLYKRAAGRAGQACRADDAHHGGQARGNPFDSREAVGTSPLKVI